MSLAAANDRPARAADRDDSRWDEAVDEHRTALAALLDAIEALRDDAWRAPWAPGKWTRAQVAEHLALSYEAAIREVGSGQAIATRVPPFRQKLLRLVVLPHILFHRSIPGRPRSPREIRPGEVTAPRAQILVRLRELGERFEHEMERAYHSGGGGLTHPYFGKIGAVKAMRFMAVHLEHHTRQIARM
ncbi:MAG TPA: DinB family protein [Longimicrobium sp.]|nr:DinB family protein [Longimicrobium sp.]